MVKVNPRLKIIVGGVLLIGVFVFFLRQTASAFQPRGRGSRRHRNQGFIGGRYKGRSNFHGTQLGNKKSMRNLAGNKTQRNRRERSIRLMRRG